LVFLSDLYLKIFSMTDDLGAQSLIFEETQALSSIEGELAQDEQPVTSPI
jgi:hypothetical protein